MSNKKEYKRRKDLGLCVSCGDRLARPGYTMCQFCADKKAVFEQKYRHANSDYFRAYDKRRKDKRRKEGKCTKCGRLLHEERDTGFMQCMNCRQHLHVQRQPYYKGRRKNGNTQSRNTRSRECIFIG